METGFFWLSSRYYSPELCRFISPDDIEYLDPESVNGLNLYCYCLNNTISYADPSGHSVIPTVFSLLDLAITYASSMIGNAVTFIGASVANAVTIVATSFELANTTSIAVATSILPIAIKTYIYKFLKKNFEKWCVDNKKEIKLFIYKLEYAIKRFFRKEPSVINQWLESNDLSQREGITENIARFSNEAGGSLKSYLDCYDVFYVDDEVNILQ